MRRQFAGAGADRLDYVRICVFFAMASWYAAVDENGQTRTLRRAPINASLLPFWRFDYG